ncbi:MAG: magnesium/cobalt efflux protein [Pelagibacterales bacterium]|nr:magnesium/cobalt efflux protein [Pelagibacterales bacterium]PPR16065.1 MAG: Hemolysin C [Alphaproteobacteria bacterium MarineAlpha9_Bin3]|tara:strand:- start:9694 stop:10524 length:831 start_codon:yes stop_codon:yes gene_type:complete
MLINKFNLNKLFLRKKNDKELDLESTRGEVRSLGKKAGLSYYDRAMLDNVIGFSSIEVEEAMVPRADIVAIPEKSTLKECIDLFRKAAHSRLPVYRGTLDEVIGMVHVKDILTFWDNDKDFILENIIRKVIISAPSTLISDLFQEMRRTKVHLSIVVDEHGGTDGLITIEDLLEEITGEIEDEHDKNFNRILNDNLDNSIIVDARIPIIELENYYSCKLINSSIDVDTLGGLIFYYEKSVPEVGKLIKHSNGLIFEIIESDMRRIKKIKITGSPKV